MANPAAAVAIVMRLGVSAVGRPSTAWRAPELMMESRDPAESAEAIDAADPMDNTDTAEPIEPTDNTDPTEPIDNTDPRLPMHSRESSDQSDQRELPVMRSSTQSGPRCRRSCDEGSRCGGRLGPHPSRS